LKQLRNLQQITWRIKVGERVVSFFEQVPMFSYYLEVSEKRINVSISVLYVNQRFWTEKRFDKKKILKKNQGKALAFSLLLISSV